MRRFTVWNCSSINPTHQTIGDLCLATLALVPAGQWDEVELLLKAGEGGSWQSSFDSHPLALNGPTNLASHIAVAKVAGVRITPYVVVRGRVAWMTDEQSQIRQCAATCGRCVLNVEPGAPYYNGANDPGFIRNYLAGCNVPGGALEVCLIPRQTQVNELGGGTCIQAWTHPAQIVRACWETYGLSAPPPAPRSLRVDWDIPRLDAWGVPQALRYRVPVCQRDERDIWAPTIWAAAGLQLWNLDSN